ncbi:MAG: 30S ribosomal protein S7 [Candidatus Odinarchaeota archaeon]
MSTEPTPEVTLTSEIKVFGRWSTKDVQVSDPGLVKYISLQPVIIPHTFGRHEHRRFGKKNIPIVERFINRLMTPGWARRRSQGARQAGLIAGKKSTAIRLIRSAFEVIHLRTGQNPIQILIQAIENAAPREETTRISYGGISYHTACDVAPLRRIDLALRFISESIWRRSFSTIETVQEAIADELIAAANRDSRSNAVRRREEKERMALSAR